MKKVLLFLSQGFEEYEASVFTDVLGWSRTYALEPVGVVTVGLRKKIKCTWNLTVEPEYLLDEINSDEFDALAIPGGFEEKGFYEDAYDERFLNLMKKLGVEQISLKQSLESAAEIILTDRKHLDNNPRKVSKEDLIRLLNVINSGKSFKEY